MLNFSRTILYSYIKKVDLTESYSSIITNLECKQKSNFLLSSILIFLKLLSYYVFETPNPNWFSVFHYVPRQFQSTQAHSLNIYRVFSLEEEFE